MNEVSIPVQSARYEDGFPSKGERVRPAEETIASFFGATEDAFGKEETFPAERSAGRTLEGTSETENAALWRDRALRLQAEMDNYRKQQRRQADAQTLVERERLLRTFIHLVDNLKRALESKHHDVQALQSGVELTYHAFMQFLAREGVIPVEPAGKRFDPELHAAVAAVPHEEAGVKAETVVEVLERGYLIDGRLLRPAQVIVAV
jgi:molecular chaperone GrpE